MKAKESYILKVLVHPIDSFWEMKFQKKAKRWIPPLLIIVYFLATIFERQLRAFSFNEAYNTPLALMYQIRIVILPPRARTSYHGCTCPRTGSPAGRRCLLYTSRCV